MSYKWEVSLIPGIVKGRIKDAMDSYESFDLYCAEAGWEDWMNEFTEAEEGEEISEREAKTIEGIQKALWDELQNEEGLSDEDIEEFFCGWDELLIGEEK